MAWQNDFGLILLVLTGISAQTFNKAAVEVSLRRGLEELIQTGKQSDELNKTLPFLQFPLLFRKDPSPKSIASLAVCVACNVFMDVALTARKAGFAKHTFQNFAEKVCVLFNIEPDPVCHGFIEINLDTLLYIADNKPDLTSERICSIFLQFMGCVDFDRQNWEIEIPARTVENKYSHKESLSEVEPLKVLQLTDIHYDIDYTIGSNAVCDAPLCCRPGTKPATAAESAGRWGDYRGCDTPWHVFTAALDHIVSQHKNLSYCYFTGDIIDHKIWGTSISRNTEVMSDVLTQLKTSLGPLKVFPVLGNHEAHPLNAYSPNDVNQTIVSTQWVLNLVADKWQMWLPAETRETILKGGYYTVLVQPGFRIVALNSNVCFLANWWLLFDDVDPYGQLKWLVGVLLEAEKNGEIVHLLSHVPTGGDSSCFWNWGRELAKIINRFSNTVVAQFNGHTHKQDTTVFFNSTDLSQPTHVVFTGGSITPWNYVNPNYVIYDIHPESFRVLDYESWTYNITDANLTPELDPVWYKLYSFKSAYGIDSLSPQNIAGLVENMAKNRSIAEQYFRFRFRESEPALAQGCDRHCHLKNLCIMVTPYFGSTSQCDIVKAMWNSQA